MVSCWFFLQPERQLRHFFVIDMTTICAIVYVEDTVAQYIPYCSTVWGL